MTGTNQCTIKSHHYHNASITEKSHTIHQPANSNLTDLTLSAPTLTVLTVHSSKVLKSAESPSQVEYILDYILEYILMK